MRLIGLTGNMASGKTAVAELLARRRAVIIDADVLAREAVQQGSPALTGIAERWGKGVLDAEGDLDRAELSHIVLERQSERDGRNESDHPDVPRLRAREIA